MSNQFNFKYSAPTEEERREIDSIRRRYAPQEKTENSLERLRKLDRIVKNTPAIWGLCLGIIGCLIFGLGLTMILEWGILIWGIVVMVVGSLPMAIAYPIYMVILAKYKDLYGEEILSLSEELLNKQEK